MADGQFDCWTLFSENWFTVRAQLKLDKVITVSNKVSRRLIMVGVNLRLSVFDQDCPKAIKKDLFANFCAFVAFLLFVRIDF